MIVAASSDWMSELWALQQYDYAMPFSQIDMCFFNSNPAPGNSVDKDAQDIQIEPGKFKHQMKHPAEDRTGQVGSQLTSSSLAVIKLFPLQNRRHYVSVGEFQGSQQVAITTTHCVVDMIGHETTEKKKKHSKKYQKPVFANKIVFVSVDHPLAPLL